MKLIKETLCENNPNSTLNTNSSSDKSLSKLNLQYRIKNRFTQEVMEKVDSEKQQDYTLNNTLDYNKSITTTSITLILVSTRIEKKKLKGK
jgi:hypothetical protein